MSAPFTQQEMQTQLGQVMQFVQTMWDRTNPSQKDKAVIGLILFVCGLADPSQTDRFNRIVKLINVTGDADKARVIEILIDADVNSSEYDLVKFILGDGIDMPSWEDIAAKVVELAVGEANTATPSAPSQPAPTPSPAPQPAPLSPTAMMNRLQPVAPTPVPTPTPVAQPANNGGNGAGDGSAKTQSGRGARRPRNR